MATFLINCSNLKVGGGLQVADSVCRQLERFKEHKFVVVLSSKLEKTKQQLSEKSNVVVYTHDISNDMRTILLGRDRFLDSLVEQNRVDAVLTLFGPSRWIPRKAHLCGFARAQIVIKNSQLKARKSLRSKLLYAAWRWGFRRSSRYFWTENPYISKLLYQQLSVKGMRVWTITNYYHQIFDEPANWSRNITLPIFKGITLLTITGDYLHKNLPIMADICKELERNHPDFHFRFVVTLNREQCPFVDDSNKRHFTLIGKVDICECPNLYEQADIMFMPTLLECFTATYPEAMRMEVPVVTTDLEFAHGLCGDAACYYSPIDAHAAAEAIYRVATDKTYAAQLVLNGKVQLKQFDNYQQRADKLISVLESIAVSEVPIEMGGVNPLISMKKGGWPHDNHAPKETDFGPYTDISSR